ncbi:MAG: hypothetical protein AB1806_10375 [Acidobacteriota bacterium]
MSQVQPWIAVLALATTTAAAPQDSLVKARQAYNRLDFDRAIAEAERARQRPELTDAAGVVLARALLERHRQGSRESDLTAAREALAQVDPGRLTPRDRGEWTIGLGESLYLSGAYGAAADIFDTAMALIPALESGPRDRLVRWWALAIDQEARQAQGAGRQRHYARMLERMESVLRSSPESTAAAYWLVVAAVGLGDARRAWDAAVAAWVRAPLAGERTEAVRADLDHLVRQLVIPECAKQAKPSDRAGRVSTLQSEWEAIRQAWSRR